MDKEKNKRSKLLSYIKKDLIKRLDEIIEDKPKKVLEILTK